MSDTDEVTVRPLRDDDLDAADRIFRIAFGTFVGAPEPERFFGDADLVRTRWRTDPDAALAAEAAGRLVGSNFATNWGSVGFFGPLTVTPEFWDRAIAQRLLDATMAIFERWGTRHAGLFTFAQSAKHVGLYQKYGFWPRYLTAVMSRQVTPSDDGSKGPGIRLSELAAGERESAIQEIKGLTDAVYPGLDLTQEIVSVETQQLGDTVFVDNGSGVQAVAVCHIGAGSEAGSGSCYVKFGAARPGPEAATAFDLLVDASLQLAADRGATNLIAGANAGRDQAWKLLAGRGFRREMQGVAMHRPNEPGYNTSNSYVIDDWR